MNLAREFKTFGSIEQLTIWNKITRPSLQYLAEIDDLTELSVLELTSPGKLKGLSRSGTLEVFRCSYGVKPADILELTKVQNLRVLSAHCATLSADAIKALSNHTSLRELDIEDSSFDDEMARLISRSRTIKGLWLGATQLTGRGLKELTKMPQLTELDIWWDAITEDEIDILADLPNLEFLSIGNHGENYKKTSTGLIPKLDKIKTLKKVWFDGVATTEHDRRYLAEKYEFRHMS
jgi:hypothetical protein